MNKRPKSREETPKEGSDSARRYRTATICDRAAQSASPFELFPVHSLLMARLGIQRQNRLFTDYNQILKYDTDGLIRPCVTSPNFPLEFVIGDAHWKFTPLRQVESLSEIKIGSWRTVRADGAEVAGLR
jgi:hypothetical protein